MCVLMSDINWETYKIAVGLPSFKRKLARSKAVIEEFLARAKRPYLALSGGKDSVVCAHLVSQIDPDMQIFSQCDDLDWPGLDTHLKNIIKTCGLKDHIIGYSEVSAKKEFKMALRIGKETKSMHEGCFRAVIKKYVEDYNRDGVILGLREQESKGRRLNLRYRGLIYSKKDGVTTCCPIGKWDSKEVIGYIAKNNLPLFHIYTKLGQHIGIENVRMCWPIHPQFIAQGNVFFMRLCYPDYWRELIKDFPELAQYV